MGEKINDCGEMKALSPVKLFLFFLKIGCFTFGGGWSILAQMEQEFVEKRAVISKEELMDITSVGRSVPGIMITNISVIFGYRVAGIRGAIACVCGITCSPVVIVTIVTFVYTSMMSNVYVGKMMEGIRSAVVPIIGFAALSLGKTALKNKWCVIICAVAFILNLFAGVGSIKLVAVGVVLAAVWTGVRKDGTA